MYVRTRATGNIREANGGRAVPCLGLPIVFNDQDAVARERAAIGGYLIETIMMRIVSGISRTILCSYVCVKLGFSTCIRDCMRLCVYVCMYVCIHILM